MPIQTKSVFTDKAKSDGLRILCSRFRGHGVSSDRYDVWMPNLGPSEDLLRSFLAGTIEWQEFARLYKAELRESSSLDVKNRTIRNHGQKFTLRLLQQIAKTEPITLMCQCAEDEEHCHRHILAKILSRPVN
jgi:uncharacterized protein YeaO (DUF488 family)